MRSDILIKCPVYEDAYIEIVDIEILREGYRKGLSFCEMCERNQEAKSLMPRSETCSRQESTRSSNK